MKRLYDLSTAPYRDAAVSPRHNSLYSAEAQCGVTESWRKDLTSTSGWGQQGRFSSFIHRCNCADWRYQEYLGRGIKWVFFVYLFVFILWLIWFMFRQDGNGKVSRVIRIGTRKSQVQYYITIKWLALTYVCCLEAGFDFNVYLDFKAGQRPYRESWVSVVNYLILMFRGRCLELLFAEITQLFILQSVILI